MGLTKLMQDLHKRAEIPYSIPNIANCSWVGETSLKFSWTAKEAQITRLHVDTDLGDSFSEFNCLSGGYNFGMF